MTNSGWSGVDFADIKRKADSILLGAGVRRPPVPIKDIVEENDIDVEFVEFGKYGRDISGISDFGRRIIYVNSKIKFRRQMLSIAHEFGHWILHEKIFNENPDKYEACLTSSPSHAERSIFEKEADAFATYILLPDFLIRPILSAASLPEISRIFAVSRKAVDQRLRYA